MEQLADQDLKLFNFAKSEDLKRALGPQHYYTLVATVELQKVQNHL